MGLLDALLAKKENPKTQKPDKNKRLASSTNRRAPPPLQPSAPPNANRLQRHQPTPLPPTSSIFGSLKRSKGGGAGHLATIDHNKNVQDPSNGHVKITNNKTVRKPEKRNEERRGDPNDFGRKEAKIGKQTVKFGRETGDQFVTRRKPKLIYVEPPKPKRAISIIAATTSGIRGQHKDGQVHVDNLSRNSSVTNLDSLESNYQGQGGKGAKPRKAASKEIIDKTANDGKKGVIKNNNKLEPPVSSGGQPLSYSSDSLQETEFQQLRKQLREMADEKTSLALQLGEQRGQLNVLQKEIQKLKSFQEESNVEMERLAEENTSLRNRLREVAYSPLSDNEKQQLLFESKHHSSAPASIATNVIDENGGEATTCTTPDWDKHSSGNVSEVSVACLQDKINQMQETHYSTNEELQATLQELTDLQRQLTELQQENERVNEEKTLMFDSLCRQTERLNDTRQEMENLKQLLYRERNDENQLESVVEREQHLVELLKSTQEEREALLMKLEQVQAELHDSKAGNIEKVDNIAQLSERVKTLECSLDAKNAEHKQLDQELAQSKDQCSGKQIEINRLTDLLENARTKINELEQDRALSDKSELDELLDNARKEKDQLESEVAYLKEQLARSKNEIEKLKEQVFVLQEECKVTRNNAKTTQSDLEYKCEKLVTEKNNLNEQLQQFQEGVNELQVQAQCHLEDKRQLSAVLSETQKILSEAERRNLNLDAEIEELKKLRAEENDEWEKFQSDLLTSVRVANDFKTEAQQELQKIILENKTYRERVRLLEGQLEKLKGEKTSTSTQTNVLLPPQLVAIAKNLDPTLPNRLSLWDNPSSPTENMEKLFPILKRSRSREFLDESGLSRSRSREKINEKKMFHLNQDNVVRGEKRQGSGMLQRTKSYENELDLLGKPTTKKIDEQNKISNTNSKSKNSDVESKSKFSVKKREKNPVETLKTTHRKTVSVEEEILLKSLDDWYKNIDQNVPDELLSKEDKAVKKLKQLFEDDLLKAKPIAKKPKEQLAISKPLLNSVVSNPQLKEIIRNPLLPSLEIQAIRESALEDVYSIINDDFTTDSSPYSSRTKHGYKSRSLDYLNVFEEYRTETDLGPVVFRADTIEKELSRNRISSDIQPNDSVSNPRYSSKYYHQIHELKKPLLPKRTHVYVNYENLEDIISKIPEEVAEDKLTEEQKFSLRLKTAFEEAGKKATLRKLKKKNRESIRDVHISVPTVDSVEKNSKLKEILLNPKIKKADEVSKSTFYVDTNRHSTDISSDIGSRGNTLQQSKTITSSKSYDDIDFSFVPENTLLNLFLKEQAEQGIPDTQKYSATTTLSSFTSAEFNLDTGEITLPNNKCVYVPMNRHPDNLLYNETWNKSQHKTKIKQWESVPNLNLERKNERFNVETILPPEPNIKQVSDRYQNDLKALVKTIEVDELRKSLRKPKFTTTEEVVKYETAEVVDAFDTKECEATLQELQPERVEGDRKEEYHKLPQTDSTVTKSDANVTFTYVAPNILEEKPAIQISHEVIQSFIDHERMFSDVDRITNKTITLSFEEPVLEEEHTSSVKIAAGKECEATLQELQPERVEGHREKEYHKLPQTDSTVTKSDADVTLTYVAPNILEEKPTIQISPELIQSFIDHERMFSDLNRITNKTITLSFEKPALEEEHTTATSSNVLDKYENNEKNLDAINILDKFPISPTKSMNISTVTEVVDERNYSNLGDHIFDVYTKKTVVYKPDTLNSLSHMSVTSGYSSITDRSDVEHEEPTVEIVELHDHEEPPVKDLPIIDDVPDNFAIPPYPVDAPPPLPLSPPPLIQTPGSGDAPLFPQEIISSQVSEPHHYAYDTTVVPPNPIISDSEYPDSITQSDSNISKPSDNYATIKENRYGVISPLHLRQAYRTVVKEYKKKFPQDEPVEIQQENDDSDLEYQEDFIDEFFKPVRPFLDEEISLPADQVEIEELHDDNDSDVVLRAKEVRINQIDQDMKDIMDQYLHTRASLIVKKTGVDYEENKTNLRKFEKFENLQDISSREENRRIFTPYNKVETSNILSPDELSFIAKMQEKYGTTVDDTTADSEQTEHEFKEQLRQKIENLTDDELDLVKSVEEDYNLRPLSGLNEKDLLMVREISQRYENNSNRTSFENTKPSSPNRSIQEHITSVELKNTGRSVSPRPASLQSNIVLRHPKASSSQTDSRRFKRLSDSIFKETIIVPLPKGHVFSSPKSPLSPTSPTNRFLDQDKSHFKETILASHTSTLDQPTVECSKDNVGHSEVITATKEFKRHSTPVDISSSLTTQKSESNFRESLFVPKNNARSSYTDLTTITKATITTTPPNLQRNSYKEVIFIPNSTESRNNEVIKPLPAPRSRNQSFRSPESPDETSRHIDRTVTKLHFSSMNKSVKNFSEKTSQRESNPHAIDTNIENLAISKELDDTFIFSREKSGNMENSLVKENVNVENHSGGSSSHTIVISSKVEQLDITSPPDDDVEEIPRRDTIDQSNVNLFQMDSQSSYQSYLDLFKSKESKEFDSLKGRKKIRGIEAEFTLLTEDPRDSLGPNHSSNESQHDFEHPPKVIDFVPIDDNTTPYYTKPGTTPNYDTLEREKTFQVLEHAAQISHKSENEDRSKAPMQLQKSDLESSLESLVKKTSSTHVQTKAKRTSFNQAKRLFESLADPGKDDRPKSMADRRTLRAAVRDSKSVDLVQGWMELGKPKK